MSDCFCCGTNPYDIEGSDIAYYFPDARCEGCDCTDDIRCSDQIVCTRCAGQQQEPELMTETELRQAAADHLDQARHDFETADRFSEMAEQIVSAMRARGATTTGELIAKLNEERNHDA